MEIRTVIPSGIFKEIKKLATTPTELEYYSRICWYMSGLYYSRWYSFKDPLDISVDHWRNVIGTHYSKYLKALKQSGVIQVVKNAEGKESYHYYKDGSARLGQCKQYFFDFNLIFSDPEVIKVSTKAEEQFSKNFEVRQTVKILKRIQLTLNKRGVEKYVRNLVTYEYIKERLKLNSAIPRGSYYLAYSDEFNKRSDRAYPLKDLILIAERNGLDLILDTHNNKCYLNQADAFIWERVYRTRGAYLTALIKLLDIRKAKNINCSRNDTNNRLDTNLTTLENNLMEDLVTLDGEKLLSIDLRNSQFTFLAHAIENGHEFLLGIDRKHFKENYNITSVFRGRAPHIQRIDKGIDKNRVINRYRETICLIYVTHFYKNIDSKSPISNSLSEDLQEFIKLSKNGLFYEKLASHLSSKDLMQKFNTGEKNISDKERKLAKRTMFLTSFSAHRYNPKEKQILAKHYPTLVLFMNAFKKISIQSFKDMAEEDPEGFKALVKQRGDKYVKLYKSKGAAAVANKLGNAELAVMLQKIESSLFIDTILVRLLKEGYRVLSKHDSIICKESDYSKVKSIVTEELDSFFGVNEYQIGE